VKALFAALLCLVLTATQTFAIKGGPPYPANTNLVGSFAGVMQGVFDPTTPSSSNSIGVYSIGVPKTGNATGPFVMFARGRVFSGTITATADPTKATIKGVLNATFNYNISVLVGGQVETIPVTATANGPLLSTVSSTKNKNTGTASTVMQGTAVLNISQGEVAANGDPVLVDILSLTVSGYKQSDAAPTGTGG
jgi:hypothetical protein